MSVGASLCDVRLLRRFVPGEGCQGKADNCPDEAREQNGCKSEVQGSGDPKVEAVEVARSESVDEDGADDQEGNGSEESEQQP
jgi:hypothetical protein